MIRWTIRVQSHTASKLTSATLLSSAAAFLAHSALWSGNNAQRVYAHRLQHHSQFLHQTILKSFCLVCAQTRSKNRSGQLDDILLLTTYNVFLCRLALSSHLHPPIRPIHRRKNQTFFLFFQPCCSTQEREGCIVKPPHTRIPIHSLSLSHPPTS